MTTFRRWPVLWHLSPTGACPREHLRILPCVRIWYNVKIEIHIIGNNDVMRVQHHGVQVCWPLLEAHCLCEAVSFIRWRAVYHSQSELGATCCILVIAYMLYIRRHVQNGWSYDLHFHAELNIKQYIKTTPTCVSGQDLTVHRTCCEGYVEMCTHMTQVLLTHNCQCPPQARFLSTLICQCPWKWPGQPTK